MHCSVRIDYQKLQYSTLSGPYLPWFQLTQFDITSNVQRCRSVFSVALYKNVEFVRRRCDISWNWAHRPKHCKWDAERHDALSHYVRTLCSQTDGQFSGTALWNLFSNFIKSSAGVSHGGHSRSTALPKQSENASQVPMHTKFLCHSADG